MSLFDAVRHRLRIWLRPGAYQRELDQQAEFHLSLEAMQQAHRSQGALTDAQARAAARRRFGNLTALQEETRTMAGLNRFDSFRQDLRFALRTLRHTPGFTAVAVLTLALGIGANTALFSAVDALLLRPLPFPTPDRLMAVNLTVPAHGDEPTREDGIWSYPKFTVFRDAQTVFSDLALFASREMTLGWTDEAERVRGEVAGGRYFSTLGVQPSLGRPFLAEEDQAPGGSPVAVLSHALWTQRFHADPAVLGQSLRVDGRPYTIVGVMPEGFRGLSGQALFWISLMSQSTDELNGAWDHSYWLVARLKPNISAAEAAAEVRQLGSRVDAAYPAPPMWGTHWGAVAKSLDQGRVDPRVRRSLLVLLGAVGLVLLIACANVANLLLVRAQGRRREVAIRLAVGAGRGRLVRQFLTESLLLSLLGGAASLLLAWWGVHILSTLNPADALKVQRLAGLGVVSFGGIRLDQTALLFALGLSVLTGLGFGLAPALAATRLSLTGTLKEEVPQARARGFGARNFLAAGEIALALMLLVGAGLMLRSLGNLMTIRLGFDPDRVLTLRFNPKDDLGRDSLPVLYDRILERLRGVPGVVDVALGDCPPLADRCNGTLAELRDRPAPAPGSEPQVGINWITPSWPAVMGVPLKRGRLFNGSDRAGVRKVVLVNETAARKLWPNQDPIGRPIGVRQGGFWKDTAYVVGVVGDVRYQAIDSLPRSDVYLPYFQSPRSRIMIFLKTAGLPTALASSVRNALREVEPDFPVSDLQSMEERAGAAVSYVRFSTMLLTLFGALALGLATVGIYGVIAFAVTQRTREIGVRMALGARRSDVLRLVIGQGLLLAVVGTGVGLVGALAAVRVLSSLLYGVAPSDPGTLVSVVAILVTAALLAAWIPAQRATRIDPVDALRRE